MKKSILSIAVVAAMIVGCKKSDDDKSRRDMLIGKWTISQFGFDANGNGIVDVGETGPAVDSIFGGNITFNSDGSLSTISTSGGTNDTSTGQWSLLSNDTYLRTITDGDTTDAEIKALSSNSLTVRDTTYASSGMASWVILSK
jgi:hypothetical protein